MSVDGRDPRPDIIIAGRRLFIDNVEVGGVTNVIVEQNTTDHPGMVIELIPLSVTFGEPPFDAADIDPGTQRINTLGAALRRVAARRRKAESGPADPDKDAEGPEKAKQGPITGSGAAPSTRLSDRKSKVMPDEDPPDIEYIPPDQPTRLRK